jgi:NitT/TauT family transport system substrate-binding protein
MKIIFPLLLAVLLATPASAADHVNVSVFQSVSDAGVYVALDRGYFAAAGIDVSLSQLDATTMVDTALASGQIDVAGGSPSAGVYNAIRQGVPIHIVADKGSMPAGHGYIGLVVRNKLTLDTLKGKRLAWAAFDVGGTNAVALDHLLRLAGLAAQDVDPVNLTFGDSLAALASGGVDGAYLIEPLMQAAVARGIGSILLTGDKFYPNQQVAVLLYGPGFWQHHPDVATRFMVAYLRGVRDYDDAFNGHGDRAGITAILAAHTTVKATSLYDRMVMPGLDRDGRVNLPGMREDLHWFQTQGLVRGPLDDSALFDASFVDAAAARLK